MKLTIGENIRNFRRTNDLTQEALADRLGVTYQTISRWENGTTYPDLELLPAISEVLSVTVDELLGMSSIEKEKRAKQAFDELRRECMKGEYDADKIVNLLRDIRRNYLDIPSQSYRPWMEGNDRAFSDPKILPEVRLLAEAYLKRHPMHPYVLTTMAEVEDEEHLADFLENHTTSFDCSQRALLRNRYLRRGEAEKYDEERRYHLFNCVDELQSSRTLVTRNASNEDKQAAKVFIEKMMDLIRCDAEDDGPDAWTPNRLEIGLGSAARLVAEGKQTEALCKVEEVVCLLEKTMQITEKTLLPISCRFLQGMEWYASEQYGTRYNDPDGVMERYIYFDCHKLGCYCVYPGDTLEILSGKDFEPLRDHPEFSALCARVKALVVIEE